MGHPVCGKKKSSSCCAHISSVQMTTDTKSSSAVAARVSLVAMDTSFPLIGHAMLMRSGESVCHFRLVRSQLICACANNDCHFQERKVRSHFHDTSAYLHL